MTEEQWQRLVADALVRTLGLRQELLFHEVPTRDGSRADIVYVHGRRVVIFELKMAEPGQALAPLDARATRQLRHFCQAAHAAYLVTVGAPRTYTLAHDGRAVHTGEVEVQSLPEGVGWIAFDRLSLEAVVLRPAPELEPAREDLLYLLGHLEDRISRVTRALREARA